jgi:pimeloyl-ACP methyl ester carboxylesterase
MDRRQKALVKRLASVFVPLLILFVITVVGSVGYVSYRITHPVRRPVRNTPFTYERLLQRPIWDDVTWNGARGATISGWIMFQDHPAPTVVLTHGYGTNREVLLSSAFKLWEAGYFVVAYDLRGHGASSVDATSLGPAELDDLMATVKYARDAKNEAGEALSDGRVGLFGIDLGGFISLAAAARDEEIRAVAADTIYPSQDDYIKYQTKSLIGADSAPNSSFLENGLIQSAITVALSLTAEGGTRPPSAKEAFAKIGARPVLLFVGKTSPLYGLWKAAAPAAGNARTVELEASRSGRALFKRESIEYDQTLVDFFTAAPDFLPPSRPVIDRGDEETSGMPATKPDKKARQPVPH